MRLRRMIASALSIALLVGVIPADTAISDRVTGQFIVHAEERVETIATDGSYSQAHTYSGSFFAISVDNTGDGSGFILDYYDNKDATVRALYGYTITRLELVRGDGDGVPVSSAGNRPKVTDNVITISNIDSTSVNLTGDTSGSECTIKEVKVYYEIRSSLSGASVTLDDDHRVTHVKIGDMIVPETEYDVTYGESLDTATPDLPADIGMYYAFVTAKEDSQSYYGTAKSKPFVIYKEEPGAVTVATDTYSILTVDFDKGVLINLPEECSYICPHFYIDADYGGNGEGFHLDQDGEKTAVITANKGYSIKRLELTREIGGGIPDASDGTITQVSDDVFVITDLDAESVKLTGCTGDILCTIKKVKIYYEYFRGDANGDSALGIADVVELQNWLLNAPNTDIPYWKNADINEDGRLDALDLSLLRKTLIEDADATYTIRLEKVGEDITLLTSTISIINKYLGCGLGEAKSIVNSAPVTITDSASKADAVRLVADLRNAGASVTVIKNR